MKNIIKILICVLLNSNLWGQVLETVPLNTDDNYNNGVYFKDINNELDSYIGTYEGVLNNKKYIFVFQKYLQVRSNNSTNSYRYFDEIKGKFKVIDLNTNTVIYNGLSATNPSDYLIYSITKANGGLFNLYFKDTDANCQNSMQFALRSTTSPNTFKYCYFSYDDWWNDDICSYTDRMAIPVYLPKEDFILTKL